MADEPNATEGLAGPDTPAAPAAPAEPSGPDWSAFEQAGITPDKADEVRQAYDLYRGLQNLDTRGQYLQQIVRPDIDAQVIQNVFGEPEEEHDPWAQVFGQEEPDEPQFDPRALPQVFDQYKESLRDELKREIFGELSQMAMSQEFDSSAQTAVQQHGLPPSDAQFIRSQVEQVARQYPNRQPREIADEIARQRKTELMQWAGAPAATPAPAGGPQGGPAPAPTQPPSPGDDPGTFGLG